MAQTCITIPTLTSNAVSMAHITSVTERVSTSTAPGSVGSTVIETCIPPDNLPSGATATCSPTETTIYTTFPGSTTVITVPVTVVEDYPVTNQVTLFGSSCNAAPGYTPPPTTYTSTSTSTSWSMSTAPPVIFTSSSVVTSGGSTYISIVMTTSTFAPVSVPIAQTGIADQNSGRKKSNIGPIVGGALGGLVALLLLGFIILRLFKQNALDKIFDTDFHHNKIINDPEPKSFGYGPVQGTNPTTMSPPPPRFNDSFQPSQLSALHQRSPSQTPLLGAMGMASAGAGATSTFNTSQASSSASRPLRPMGTQAPQVQAQGYPPSNYQPAFQNWGGNQGTSQPYGAANMQGEYNAPGFAPGSGQPTGLVHPSSHAPSPSIISVGSAYTADSWPGNNTGLYQPPIVPTMGGPVRNNQQQQYEDSSNRTGSPVSFHDQRILQVVSPSAGPSSVVGSSQGPSSSDARDGKGRPLVLVGEKVPTVHLDGGAFEQPPAPVPAAQTSPAPPAYSYAQ